MAFTHRQYRSLQATISRSYEVLLQDPKAMAAHQFWAGDLSIAIARTNVWLLLDASFKADTREEG
jgi:hypothetical protein